MLWLLPLLSLLLAGCVTIDVQNFSDLNARVRITVPDSAAPHMRHVPAGDTASSFSNYGGRVQVAVVPDEEYRQLLLELQEEIGERLWTERESLTGSEVARMVNQIATIERSIEQLQTETEGAVCTVSAPDFSAVTAVITWSGNRWDVDCSVEVSEEE